MVGARVDPTVLDEVRQLVEPFARGEYVDDWAERAAAVSLLSDICGYALRENAYWSPDVAAAATRALSVSPTRRAVLQTGYPLTVAAGAGLAFNVPFEELSESDRAVVADAVAGLDGAEKVVISAAAYSLCELDNSPELTLELMNLLYEEALHLDALGRVVGLDHDQVAWIRDDRKTNWDLVRRCSTPMEYMVLEHCLYEGRGTIASAAGAFYLERAGVPSDVVSVFTAISMQEANHNVSGFRWLKLLDTSSPGPGPGVVSVMRMFLDAEPLPARDGSSRSLRKHFPFYLIQRYRESRDFYQVKQEIVSASRAARATGRPHVPADRLYAASREAVTWCRKESESEELAI